jgi:hypothetical protein
MLNARNTSVVAICSSSLGISAIYLVLTTAAGAFLRWSMAETVCLSKRRTVDVKLDVKLEEGSFTWYNLTGCRAMT